MGLVHRNEPLRRRTKDHRILTAPTMWIAVFVVFRKQQHAALLHELDDFCVSLKHTLTCEVFNLGRETSSVIDRTVDIEAITLSDHEIVVTMSRRGMYCSCPGLTIGGFFLSLADIQFGLRVRLATQSYMFANHQERNSIKPRVTSLESVKF